MAAAQAAISARGDSAPRIAGENVAPITAPIPTAPSSSP